MKKASILLLSIIAGCNMSDATSSLGSGYTLIIEGKGANRIISAEAYRKGVTADIVQYANFNDFIIIQQQPTEFIHANDDDDVEYYPDGRENLHYWIIFKEDGERIGPLSETKFKEELEKNNLPSTIEWKTIYKD